VEGKKDEIIRVSLCSVVKASRKKNLHERRETRKRSPKDGSRRAQSAIASRTVFRTTPTFRRATFERKKHSIAQIGSLQTHLSSPIHLFPGFFHRAKITIREEIFFRRSAK